MNVNQHQNKVQPYRRLDVGRRRNDEPTTSTTTTSTTTGRPNASLFDPNFEKAACGVGFIVNINGIPSRKLLDNASTMSERMTHRGACSCDNLTGDGAGIMIAIPDQFYRQQLASSANSLISTKTSHDESPNSLSIELPPKGFYATGLIFLDSSSLDDRLQVKQIFTQMANDLGIEIIHWRLVPKDNSCLGKVAIDSEPHIEQVFVAPKEVLANDTTLSNNHHHHPHDHISSHQNVVVDVDDEFHQTFRRKIFMLRKHSTHQLSKRGLKFYCCSLSNSTIVYKGQFTPAQLWQYYLDLQSPDLQTYLAIVHARFSTNTYPSWERAHPMRLLAHNGEINTLRGNVNMIHAREGAMKSDKLGDQLSKLYPVIEPDMSDSGSFDNVLEFLVNAGDKSLPEAVLCMVPEAWQNDTLMPTKKRSFYQWASCTMEPWDGPALFTFTDGRYIGAILDRNGLRPSRFYELQDGHLIMASEVGVIDAEPSTVLRKGRLRPGRMLLIDVKNSEVMDETRISDFVLGQRPYDQWISGLFTLEDLKRAAHKNEHDNNNKSQLESLTAPPTSAFDGNNNSSKKNSDNHHSYPMAIEGDVTTNTNTITTTTTTSIDKPVRSVNKILEDKRLTLFGYTTETINLLLLPMIRDSKEALGSMGNDAPLACLSLQQPLIYDYFKQLFAQITNPPIDPFREKIIMSLSCPIGPEHNILEASARQCQRLWLDHPIISISDLELIKQTNYGNLKTKLIDCTFSIEDGKLGLVEALDRICNESAQAAKGGYAFLILSDRNVGPTRVPISSILSLGAIHHHLINVRQRMSVGLIVESAEAREVHHMCVLLGYGADAICPYLVFETLSVLKEEAGLKITDLEIYNKYSMAMKTGISKVMAKMGISTLQSYKGAQIFEAVGLSKEVVDKCFKSTPSRIEGSNFEVLASEALNRHRQTYQLAGMGDNNVLRDPGFYHWRSGGEKHINDPVAIANLQDAARVGNKQAYRDFSNATINMLKKCTLRGQCELVYAKEPVPLDEVEDARLIVRRFCTGAMSFGSISIEAHETLAMAMNKIGGRSNTGEGGEDEERWMSQTDPNRNKRSAIKQIASGRFGVTAAYVANADELQIKIAQGAKPGEGGELPGHKVSEEIAKTRHSIPGVGLISPPPHHDIYSIEDIAELMYDLKCANPRARISVKLVSEVGVGIVAAGVAKGKAEHIVISGHDGGTGASSWTGIKNAGLPWELGLSETHQVLVANDLRSRVVLQVDGQLRTAFDVLFGALLGADEFGFSTAPLIALGCIMMRKCHLNTCPVGIATQDPVLRKKFEGKPEHLINYLFLLAEDIRLELSKLGFRSLSEIIGRTDLLKFNPDPENHKVNYINLDAVLCNALSLRPGTDIRGGTLTQDYQLENRLDNKLIEIAKPLLDGAKGIITTEMKITNKDRAFASTLSYEIASRFGEQGLGGNDRLNINLTGTAGQSFCAFLPTGVTIKLDGDANDYVAKGLSGGKVVVKPPAMVAPNFKSEENIIVGNVCLYGATCGKAFIRGIASERFCVRNSGALAVVEGIGDHGCEYMTGGTVVILGATGRNFAAGMSGGLAYVWNPVKKLQHLCYEAGVDLLDLTDQAEIESLKKLIEQMVEETGSQRAKDILADWSNSVTKFTKVFPKEYQRALKQMEHKRSQALQKPVEQQQPIVVEEIKETVTIKSKDTVKDIEDTKDQELDKVRGFMKYKRIKGYYRNPNERMSDWSEIFDQKLIRDNVRVQATRCMECGVPLCQTSYGCPLGNIIPKWNDLVHKDNWEEALVQLSQTNNFPEFTGRVCPAPCEGACVLGINEKPVAIKTIEVSIIEVAFERGWIKPQPPKIRTGKKVAVVGSGPAGLACAAQLNKAGHTVTVYERNDRVGGLLQYGIPSMKLSKAVVQRRINLMIEEGINFKTGVNVGKTIKVQDLYEQNDAICVTTGATWPRDLTIPGRNLNGIYYAMTFLETWQKQQMLQSQQQSQQVQKPTIDAKDKRVVVIGGGDTGCDCIGTCLRQGAKKITSFEILPKPGDERTEDNPWPQWPKVLRTDYGYEEVKIIEGDDPRIFCISSKKFVDDGQGNICGIETIQVEWYKDETSGQYKLRELPGSEKFYPCDLVLIAMGFLGPENYVAQELGLELDQRSNIKTKQGTYRTSIDRVYSAGDCRRGQSLVVHAINEGRQAAREIDSDFNHGLSMLAGPGGIVSPPAISN